MRLLKAIVAGSVLAGLGWIATQSVQLESTPDEVRITINRQKLRQAGHELKTRGSLAVSRVGQALDEAGQTAQDQENQQEPPSGFERIFSR